MPKPKIERELAYYINIFKVEGHTTWRADLKDNKEGFEKQFTNPQNKRPSITERKTFRIDKVTGEFTQV